MRFAILLTLLLVAAGCSKNAKVIKRIEGTWKLTEMLMNDGQRTYPNTIFTFEKGEKGGDSYAAFTRYAADYSDTVKGTYLVDKKATKVVLRYDEMVPVQTYECTLDDMDAGMLIIRSVDGVMYLYKQ
jgi:hypothetical protein